MTNTKGTAAMDANGDEDRLLTLMDAADLAVERDRPAALAAIADATRALKRIAKRAEALPAEYEVVEIKQSRGPTIEFGGRLLCEEEYETRGRDPLRVTMQIWETQGGAMVAATYSEPSERDGFETVEATVVKPCEDSQAMRFAVMDHFDWALAARSMVTKKLGWSLRLDVE